MNDDFVVWADDGGGKLVCLRCYKPGIDHLDEGVLIRSTGIGTQEIRFSLDLLQRHLSGHEGGG